MKPDAIVVFAAGVMPVENGGWRTTTYEESDAFGTLGGRDRVEAAALLARQYPSTCLLTTSSAYVAELIGLGVPPKRIREQKNASNTETGISEALGLAQENSWKHLLFVSSEFHIPRIKAFYAQAKSPISGDFVSSESILVQHDPAFAEYFEKVKKKPDYARRLEAEKRGREAIEQGSYHPSSIEDKKERSV